MKIRAKFSKQGSVKFIGHLDLMRYFQKAIRRAEIDAVYTEGFSPHHVLSFAAPLGVGLESVGEYLDLAVHSMVSCQDIREKLNAVMAEGIYIENVTLLPENAGNAMASVAAAEYLVRFRIDREPQFDWKSQLSDFYAKDCILVRKKTKKSEVELDLKPNIYQLFVEGEGIRMTVDASSAGNIKPSLVLEAFYKEYGQLPDPFDWEITRLETYRKTETEQGWKLVPMDEVDIGA